MNEQTKCSRNLKRYWKQKLLDWKASGQSGQAWCREQNHSYYHFNYWKKILSVEKDPPPKPNASETFVELIEERATKTSGIKIESKNITISLEEGFDIPTLKKVLQLLQEATPC